MYDDGGVERTELQSLGVIRTQKTLESHDTLGRGVRVSQRVVKPQRTFKHQARDIVHKPYVGRLPPGRHGDPGGLQAGDHPAPRGRCECHTGADNPQADWHNANDPRGCAGSGRRNGRPAHSPLRNRRGGQLVARGRNLQLDAEHSYGRIYMAAPFLGQGIARALMARLLADDIIRGARLYVGLGYRIFQKGT